MGGKIVGLLIVSIVLGLIIPMLGALFGGIAGWLVGIFFVAPSQVAEIVGVPMTDFQVGAMLGFVGGFLKTTVSSSS